VETRVFTFGIGAGASAHLVRGIARAGEGEAEFIYPGERIEEKVMRQLKRALTPALTDVQVDWNGLSVTPAPHHLPPVFAGGRLLAYGLLDTAKAAEVVLRAKGPDGPVDFTLWLDPEAATPEKLIATLAAKALIRDLEEGRSALHDRRGSLQNRGESDRVKQEIVRLGVSYGLVSRETSYVAVEERATPVLDPAVLRKVPVALTRGWGGLRDAVFGGADTGSFAIIDGSPAASRLGAAKRASAMMPEAALGSSPRVRSAFRKTADWLLAKRAPGVPSLAPAACAIRPLDRLVALQRADGYWDLSADLAEILGRPLAELETTMPPARGDAESARRAWATALALAWLEARPELRGEWELLADKARGWLGRVASQPRDGTSWTDAAHRVSVAT
jgi:hypothetical protein